MSSSGKGQSVVRDRRRRSSTAWDYAQAGGRAGAGRVIVEGFIDFDYEITLLTVRHAGGTSFCAPIGHLQDRRRLSRVVAAAADERGRAGRGAAASRARSPARSAAAASSASSCSSRAIEVMVLRSQPAPARHRPGHADLAGAVRVRAACARDPRPADSGDPPDGPSASCAVLVEGDAPRRATTAWPRRWRNRIRNCASSASPRCGPSAHGGDAGARRVRLEAAVGKAVRAAGHLRIEL